MKPRAVDLFCGLGGWAEGFLSEGYDVIGFDIERRPYPGQLVLQDALTLHGAQCRHAAVIVASPPCTEYSYMAMPWTRAKQIAGALREEVPFPEGYTGSRTVAALNALFDACFRIQREASEAAGRYIPLVVENVKGAQPWVGQAKANYGSFYLWGDIASVGGRIVRPDRLEFAGASVKAAARGQKCNPDGTEHGQGSWFAIADSKNRGARKVPGFNFHEYDKTGQPGGSFQSAAVKNGGGGSWFPIAHGKDTGEMYGVNPVRGAGVDGTHNTESGVGQNPDGGKVQGEYGTSRDLRQAADSGREVGSRVPGGCSDSDMLGIRVESSGLHGGRNGGAESESRQAAEGVKQRGSGAAWFDKALDERRKQATAIKNGGDWFGSGENCSEQRKHGSKSTSRKEASAQIAKIPFELARHIAAAYHPLKRVAVAPRLATTRQVGSGGS